MLYAPPSPKPSDIPATIREQAAAVEAPSGRRVAIGVLRSARPRARGLWAIRVQVADHHDVERLDDGATFTRIEWA